MKLKEKQRTFNRILESATTHLLRLTTGFYVYEAENFQRGEIYCQRYLNWIEKIPHVNEEDIQKNAFFGELALAKIYFEFGYPELAISTFETMEKKFKKSFSEELEPSLIHLAQLYKNIIFHFYNKDPLKSLKICKNCIDIFNSIPQTHKIKLAANIQKELMLINVIFAQSKEKYTKEFIEAAKSAEIVTNLVNFDAITFNFDTSKLTLHFKDASLNKFIEQAFREHHISYESLQQPSTSSSCFNVNLNECTPKILEKISQTCLQKQSLSLQISDNQKKIDEKAILTSEKNTTSETTSSSKNENHEIYSEKASYEPVLSKKEKKSKKKEKNETTGEKQKNTTTQITQSHTVSSNPTKPAVEFHWPKSNLTYRSTDSHPHAIQALSDSNGTPDNVWLGYIPDWIPNREKYEEKLSTGKIGKKGTIRRLKTELLTFNQNFSEQHPYIFKIAIPTEDDRLYGWLEETMTDHEGKKHHLICFGYMGDHKTRYLPDPETIKAKASSSTTPKLQ